MYTEKLAKLIVKENILTLITSQSNHHTHLTDTLDLFHYGCWSLNINKEAIKIMLQEYRVYEI